MSVAMFFLHSIFILWQDFIVNYQLSFFLKLSISIYKHRAVGECFLQHINVSKANFIFRLPTRRMYSCKSEIDKRRTYFNSNVHF